MIREALSHRRLQAMSADEAAAYWIARRNEGLSQHEEELLGAWIAEAPENADALAQAELAWHSFEDSADDELLAAMRLHALATEPSRFGNWRAMAAAAAVMLLLISSLLLLRPWSPPAAGPASGDERPIMLATARGEVRTFALPDGSSMTLDTNSSVELSYAKETRAVRLVRGRASFNVRSAPTRPFAVAAGERTILVLGTRFDVRLEPDELRVTLFEGSVSIAARGSAQPPVVLRPGQLFVERGGNAVLARSPAPAEEALSWHQGFAYFENEPLAAAAAEINRYSEEQLLVRDARISGLRISGRFSTRDAERFARTVAEIHPVQVVRRSGTEIEIVAR